MKRQKKIGYEKIIFTLYRFGNDKEAVREAINKHKIWGVTLWSSWWDNDWEDLIEKQGAVGFVHTVNDPDTAEKLFGAGVDGIYTDFLPVVE